MRINTSACIKEFDLTSLGADVLKSTHRPCTENDPTANSRCWIYAEPGMSVFPRLHSQGCRLIPLFSVLFFYLLALSVLPCCVCLSVCLSVSVSATVCLCLSVCFSVVSLSVCLRLCLCHSLSLSVSVVSISVCLSVSVCLSLSNFIQKYFVRR